MRVTTLAAGEQCESMRAMSNSVVISPSDAGVNRRTVTFELSKTVVRVVGRAGKWDRQNCQPAQKTAGKAEGDD